MIYEKCYGKGNELSLCTGACLGCESKIEATTFEDLLVNDCKVYVLGLKGSCARDEVKGEIMTELEKAIEVLQMYKLEEENNRDLPRWERELVGSVIGECIEKIQGIERDN